MAEEGTAQPLTALAPAATSGAEGVARPAKEVGIIRPIATPAEVLAAWQQFQDLKRSLLTREDYQEIQGQARIKKSGWRKIAAAFGISDQLLREERREVEAPPHGRYFVWEVTVRAIAPNGRYADAVGSCASNERRFAHADHDVRAVAHTRAKNRAIADLVGGGEVSAEELEAEVGARSTDGEPAQLRTAGQPVRADPVEPATPTQLGAIRAHLRRTGISEERVCARARVASLDALTRRGAAELLAALARQPSVA